MQMRERLRPFRLWCKRRSKKEIRGKAETGASSSHHQHHPLKREEEGYHPCPRTQVETKGAHHLDHWHWG